VPQPALKILIAEDTPTNVKQLEAVVKRLGHAPVVATNGLDAVELYAREAPDLVFMDINMPGLDGISAVKRIRGLETNKWAPIIFYSAMDSMQDIIDGLEAGGDDYIVKPASLQLLRAKINGYARLLRLQQEVLAYSQELTVWREQSEEQTRLGTHVMESLTNADGLRDPMLQHFNIAAEYFSGDLVCATRAPGDVFCVMLADAAGHGLPAALTALPLTQAFYSMAAKGFPLSSIAEELNRKLKAILPADRFVAATLAAVDVRNHTIEVWNGGTPDALFITSEGSKAMTWPSRHPPLGILPTNLFSGVTETVVFHEPGDLVLCSDGLIEAEDEAGRPFGMDGLLRHLADGQSRELRFQALRRGVDEFLAGRHARDDVSCMMVALPIDRRRNLRLVTPGVIEHHGRVEEWRLDLSYGASELRYIDVVPAVLGFLSQVNILKPHQGALFLIVSELFNNALDHGLLGLDSSTKSWIGGFEIYMQQRAERLARLEQGRIDLSFLIHQHERKALLDISINDSGPGFDFRQLSIFGEEVSEDPPRPHGRGIPLVSSLCAELVFSGRGNKAWARYLLSTLSAQDTEPADTRD
jgi:CheY-like chemotaxis protein/anti-sigma regulatory factor (Ser/Thr protein kinase)